MFYSKMMQIETGIKMVDCPKCGKPGKPTGKEFAFGVFKGKAYLCPSCDAKYNAFYRDGKFNHTVPKAK